MFDKHSIWQETLRKREEKEKKCNKKKKKNERY